MRITKISVKGLFGMFDHEISLNQESRITIVHGPNGVGKTVLMRMVNGLFHYEYELFDKIPFDLIRVDFDNGEFITVEKLDAKSALCISYYDGSYSEFASFVPAALDTVGLVDAVKEHLPDLRLMKWNGKPYWYGGEDDIVDFKNWFVLDEFYDKEHIFIQYPKIHTAVHGETPDWFRRVCQKTHTVFIGIERMQSNWFLDIDWDAELEAMDYGIADILHLYDPMPEVEKIRTNLSRDIENNTSLYRVLRELQKSLDSTELLAKRGIAGLPGTANPSLLNSDSYKKWKALRYEIANADEELLSFVAFEDIINDRFLFKALKLTRYDDLKFVADDGSEIPLSALSSGEQHLLSLYYKLIFEIEPDTLVMIDEPELSMNVVWQRNFLKDLQRIIELRNFDVLLATHSPQIIHDKWDWMVPLGEKADD